ncbi:MAG TPA: globin [candidate division Zixibacteria bacterium]|nr:globin [candidate division Zixibacteria bacterium]
MPVNADIIAETLPQIMADQPRFRELYYSLLKEVSPETHDRLDDNDRLMISTMFYVCIEAFLMLYDKPEMLEEELFTINNKYGNVGMLPEVQLYLKETLLQTLEQFFGKDWTRDHEAAWDETIGMLYAIITSTDENTVRYLLPITDRRL